MSLRPLVSTNSHKQNLSQITDMMRQLNKEQTTKTFKQPGGNAIINGKLPYQGGYGSLYYDPNNVPSIVIGTLSDGSMGIVVAKDGVDVLSVIS